MDLWQRARGFAEEAAKRSQEISLEAAKRSQELLSKGGGGAADLVSDAAKRSRDLLAAASLAEKAESLRSSLKSLASDLPISPIAAFASPSSSPSPASATPSGSVDVVPVDPNAEIERFGITEELREFVKGLTITTFRDFPMQDEPQASEVPTVSNVRQDLNEWQAKHALLVLSAVKEISRFRYELCPRYMKERKFWRIYFILVNSYVSPYEKEYMEHLEKKEDKEKGSSMSEALDAAQVAKTEVGDTQLQTKKSTSSKELDLDAFLLGDLGSDDEAPDDTGEDLDADFDKIESPSDLESDEDKMSAKASLQ